MQTGKACDEEQEQSCWALVATSEFTTSVLMLHVELLGLHLTSPQMGSYAIGSNLPTTNKAPLLAAIGPSTTGTVLDASAVCEMRVFPSTSVYNNVMLARVG